MSIAIAAIVVGCSPNQPAEDGNIRIRIDMPMAGKAFAIPRMYFDRTYLKGRKAGEDWFRLQMSWPLAVVPAAEQFSAPSLHSLYVTVKDHRGGNRSETVGDIGSWYLHSTAHLYGVDDVIDPVAGSPLKTFAGSTRTNPASTAWILTFRASDGEIVSAHCAEGLWGCSVHRHWNGLSAEYQFDQSFKLDLVEIDRSVVELLKGFEDEAESMTAAPVH